MRLLTPKQAAEQLGVSADTVRAWISRTDNPLPTVVVGSSGTHRRIVADQIGPWLEAEATRVAGGGMR